MTRKTKLYKLTNSQGANYDFRNTIKDNTVGGNNNE